MFAPASVALLITIVSKLMPPTQIDESHTNFHDGNLCKSIVFTEYHDNPVDFENIAEEFTTSNQFVVESQRAERRLLQDIVENDSPQIVNIKFVYQNCIRDHNISSVRVLNLKQERAFINLIATNSTGDVFVSGFVARDKKPKLLIEIYGFV